MTPIDDAVVEEIAVTLGFRAEHIQRIILAYRQAMRARGVVECPGEPTKEMFDKIGLGNEFLLRDEDGVQFLANVPACKAIYGAMLSAIDGKEE